MVHGVKKRHACVIEAKDAHDSDDGINPQKEPSHLAGAGQDFFDIEGLRFKNLHTANLQERQDGKGNDKEADTPNPMQQRTPQKDAAGQGIKP